AAPLVGREVVHGRRRLRRAHADGQLHVAGARKGGGGEVLQAAHGGAAAAQHFHARRRLPRHGVRGALQGDGGAGPLALVAQVGADDFENGGAYVGGRQGQ